MPATSHPPSDPLENGRDNKLSYPTLLKGIAGVLSVVEIAPDGTLLATEPSGEEDDGQSLTTALLGAAADQIGEILELGAFERGTAMLDKRRVLILKREESYVALALTDQASPALVANTAVKILRSEASRLDAK